jgi:hypothetical protein
LTELPEWMRKSYSFWQNRARLDLDPGIAKTYLEAGRRLPIRKFH